jgi:AcrR family transcriptional regulator
MTTMMSIRRASSPVSATREKLIHIAFEMFGRNGFHGIGLDRIIDEAGVSKQTFYNHFESKDDLILSVLKHRHEVESKIFLDKLTQLGGDDPANKLRVLFDALHAWYDDPTWHGCIFMTAAAEFPMPHDPAHQSALEHMKAMQEHLQYLATMARARDPKMLAEELTLLLEGAVAYRHVTGESKTTDIVKRAAMRLLDEQLE